MNSKFLFSYNVLSSRSSPSEQGGILIRLKNSNTYLSYPFSIGCWFLPEALYSGDNVVVSIPDCVEVGINGTNLYVSIRGVKTSISSNFGPIKINDWFYLHVNLSSTRVIVFVNGQQIFLKDVSLASIQPKQFRIATSFQGMIRSIMTFMSCLSLGQMRDVMFKEDISNVPTTLQCVFWGLVQEESAQGTLSFINTASNLYDSILSSTMKCSKYVPLALLGKSNNFKYNQPNAKLGSSHLTSFTLYSEFFLMEDGTSLKRYLFDSISNAISYFSIEFTRTNTSETSYQSVLHLGNSTITGPKTIPSNTWIKFAVVYEPHLIRVYVDGSLCVQHPDPYITPTQTPYTIPVFPDYQMCFGAFHDGLHPFNGYMKCCVVLSDALSDSSVMDLFTTQISVNTSHVQAHFEMNSNSMIELVTGTTLSLLPSNFSFADMRDTLLPTHVPLPNPILPIDTSIYHPCRMICLVYSLFLEYMFGLKCHPSDEILYVQNNYSNINNQLMSAELGDIVGTFSRMEGITKSLIIRVLKLSSNIVLIPMLYSVRVCSSVMNGSDQEDYITISDTHYSFIRDVVSMLGNIMRKTEFLLSETSNLVFLDKIVTRIYDAILPAAYNINSSSLFTYPLIKIDSLSGVLVPGYMEEPEGSFTDDADMGYIQVTDSSSSTLFPNQKMTMEYRMFLPLETFARNSFYYTLFKQPDGLVISMSFHRLVVQHPLCETVSKKINQYGWKIINFNTWHHISIVIDGMSITIYWNGNKYEELLLTPKSIEGSHPLPLLSNGSCELLRGFNGFISSLRILNEALPVSTIREYCLYGLSSTHTINSMNQNSTLVTVGCDQVVSSRQSTTVNMVGKIHDRSITHVLRTEDGKQGDVLNHSSKINPGGFATGEFSVVFRCFVEDFDTNKRSVLLSNRHILYQNRNDFQNVQVYLMKDSATNSIHIAVRFNNMVYVGSVWVPVGFWHDIMVTYSKQSTKLSLYLNGVQDRTWNNVVFTRTLSGFVMIGNEMHHKVGYSTLFDDDGSVSTAQKEANYAVLDDLFKNNFCGVISYVAIYDKVVMNSVNHNTTFFVDIHDAHLISYMTYFFGRPYDLKFHHCTTAAVDCVVCDHPSSSSSLSSNEHSATSFPISTQPAHPNSSTVQQKAQKVVEMVCNWLRTMTSMSISDEFSQCLCESVETLALASVFPIERFFCSSVMQGITVSPEHILSSLLLITKDDMVWLLYLLHCSNKVSFMGSGGGRAFGCMVDAFYLLNHLQLSTKKDSTWKGYAESKVVSISNSLQSFWANGGHPSLLGDVRIFSIDFHPYINNPHESGVRTRSPEGTNEGKADVIGIYFILLPFLTPLFIADQLSSAVKVKMSFTVHNPQPNLEYRVVGTCYESIIPYIETPYMDPAQNPEAGIVFYANVGNIPGVESAVLFKSYYMFCYQTRHMVTKVESQPIEIHSALIRMVTYPHLPRLPYTINAGEMNYPIVYDMPEEFLVDYTCYGSSSGSRANVVTRRCRDLYKDARYKYHPNGGSFFFYDEENELQYVNLLEFNPTEYTNMRCDGYALLLKYLCERACTNELFYYTRIYFNRGGRRMDMEVSCYGAGKEHEHKKFEFIYHAVLCREQGYRLYDSSTSQIENQASLVDVDIMEFADTIDCFPRATRNEMGTVNILIDSLHTFCEENDFPMPDDE